MVEDGLEQKTTFQDIAASEACTRSGAFALLVSFFLIALIPYWIEIPKTAALGQYATLRLNLAAELDQLDANPSWQQYKKTHESAESTSIAELANDALVTKAPDSVNSNTNPPEAHQTPPGKPLAPPAPTNLSVTFHPNEMDYIIDNLIHLNDTELIAKARSATGFFDYSIFRWNAKETNLIVINKNLDAERTFPRVSLYTQLPSDSSLQTTKEELFDYLTLHDVRDLAQFELPS